MTAVLSTILALGIFSLMPMIVERFDTPQEEKDKDPKRRDGGDSHQP
jgi:putative Mg2+ transporter-C (MgtC) family protein